MIAQGHLRFRDCELDLQEWRLSRAGQICRVDTQVFSLIRYMAENPKRILSRDDLVENVWEGRAVSEAAIDSCISLARKALGDDGRRQAIIKTVPRRGYVFLPEVSRKETKSASVEATDTADTLPLPDRPSIVVRPFTALGGDARASCLAQGCRIDIQNALTKIPGIFIVAAGAAAGTAGLSTEQAGRTVGVRHALEGQVFVTEDAVRFMIQLIDTRTSEIAWSNRYDYPLGDTFKVLDEVTWRILTSLDVRLSAGEMAIVWRKTLSDPKALEIFYRGIDRFFQMKPDAMAAARTDFEKLAELHDDLSLGPTWVALTHWFDFQRGWTEDRSSARREARYWAENAVEKKDCDGQAHTVLSHVLLLEEAFDRALEAGRKAVAGRPNCTHANGFYANVLHYCGDNERARHHVQLAIRHSPVHPPLFDAILALASYGLGERDAALDAAETLIGRDPCNISGLILRMLLATDAKTTSEAVDNLRRCHPDFTVGGYLGGQPYRDQDFKRLLGDRLRGMGLV